MVDDGDVSGPQPPREVLRPGRSTRAGPITPGPEVGACARRRRDMAMVAPIVPRQSGGHRPASARRTQRNGVVQAAPTRESRSAAAWSSSSRACSRPASESRPRPSSGTARWSRSSPSTPPHCWTYRSVIALVDHQVPVRERRDLGEVRHDDDLAPAPRDRQPGTDVHGGPPADPGVDLVEDERRYRPRSGRPPRWPA